MSIVLAQWTASMVLAVVYFSIRGTLLLMFLILPKRPWNISNCRHICRFGLKCTENGLWQSFNISKHLVPQLMWIYCIFRTSKQISFFWCNFNKMDCSKWRADFFWAISIFPHFDFLAEINQLFQPTCFWQISRSTQLIFQLYVNRQVEKA